MIDVILLSGTVILLGSGWWAYRRAAAAEDPIARFWSFEIPAVAGGALILFARVAGLESTASKIVVYLSAVVLMGVSSRRIWRFIKWQFANPRKAPTLSDPPM